MVVMMRPEVLPFLGLAVGVGALIAGMGRLLVPRRKQGFAWVGVVVALVFSCYFLWFFRDPPRRPPADPLLVVAGAEGHIAGIKTLTAAEFEKIAAFNGVEGKDEGIRALTEESPSDKSEKDPVEKK